MKKIFYLLFVVFLLTSCSNKNSEEVNYKKEVMESVHNNEEKEALENIKNHKDSGVYKYISYNVDDDVTVQELVEGKSEDIIFQIINKNDYFFNDGKTITYANKEKNLYYQEDVDGIYDEKLDDETFYQDLYEVGLNKVDMGADYITLTDNDNSYSKYEADTLDLVEEKFISGGKNIIKKLESKDEDVKSAYENYIKIIEGMKKAKSVEEVTGNE